MNPIRCSKCGQKFDRRVRQQRLCDNCRPRWRRAREQAERHTSPSAHLLTPEGPTSEANPQVSGGEISPSTTFISHACRFPRERQAEVLTTGRRHPYPGDRPEWSGYCVVPCNCSCHRNIYAEGIKP